MFGYIIFGNYFLSGTTAFIADFAIPVIESVNSPKVVGIFGQFGAGASSPGFTLTKKKLNKKFK